MSGVGALPPEGRQGGGLPPNWRSNGVLACVLAWSWVVGVGLLVLGLTLVLLLLGARLWDRSRAVLNLPNRLWGHGVTWLRPYVVVELRGAENARGGPFVIAPNHQSNLDLLVLYRLPLDYRTLTKRTHFRTPMGLGLWAADYVPAPGLEEGPERSMTACQAHLSRGVSLLVFPEGSRNRTWKVGRARRGAFELAVRSGVPVLPVAIAGTNDATHPSSWRFSLGRRVIMEVLPPVPPPVPSPSADSAGELRRAVWPALVERVDALRAELRQVHGQGPEPAAIAPTGDREIASGTIPR